MKTPLDLMSTKESQITTAEGNVDRIVHERFFPAANYVGVFVDVGAARPDYLSISAYYRNLGWRVIAIEPNPEFYEMHRLRGHEVYPFACGDRNEDDVDFVLVNSHGTKYNDGEVSFESFSSLAIKDSYAALKPDLDTTTIKTKLRRLSTLFQQDIPDVNQIDILSADVEGWELEVLAGLDPSSPRPRVMIIENLFDDEGYRSFLEKRDYLLWKKIAPNEIYVDRRFLNWGPRRWRFELERLFARLNLRMVLGRVRQKLSQAG